MNEDDNASGMTVELKRRIPSQVILPRIRRMVHCASLLQPTIVSLQTISFLTFKGTSAKTLYLLNLVHVLSIWSKELKRLQKGNL